MAGSCVSVPPAPHPPLAPWSSFCSRPCFLLSVLSGPLWWSSHPAQFRIRPNPASPHMPPPRPCPPLGGRSQASSPPQLHFFSFPFDSHLSLPNRFRFLPSLKTDGQVTKSPHTPKSPLLLPSSLAVIYHFVYAPSSLKMFNWRILTTECNSHCFFSCKLKAVSACFPHSICLVELQCPHQPSGDVRS